ncbi:DUF1656 domain-containing protein [Vibrio methylphosphonaticus]|uniref:DUF1656 domain-containing protein n=1 Tax=Vibrio methylphosphonaticus TaxID=2946866 RepID=UPI00387399CD
MNELTFAMPHELELGGIYFPPLLLTCTCGYLLALLTSRFIVKRKWHRHFACYALVEIAIAAIYVVLLNKYIVWS